MEVVHARETMEVFDAIGYCKGASMIYMLQHYLGLEDLQVGDTKCKHFVSVDQFSSLKNVNCME